MYTNVIKLQHDASGVRLPRPPLLVSVAAARWARATKGGWKKGDGSSHSFETCVCVLSNVEFYKVSTHLSLLLLLISPYLRFHPLV